MFDCVGGTGCIRRHHWYRDPVRIQEIAEKTIELSGRDIEIVYVGLRPGEKLHEELLGHGEEMVSSAHPKIFVLKSEAKSPEKVLAQEW